MITTKLYLGLSKIFLGCRRILLISLLILTRNKLTRPLVKLQSNNLTYFSLDMNIMMILQELGITLRVAQVVAQVG